MRLCNPILIVIAFLCAVYCSAQNDCVDAIVVCGNTGFQGLTATGSGIDEIGFNNTCGSQENNSIWLKLPIKTGGTLGFTLVPESTDIFEDFDFFIFGPNVTCGALGNSIRCSTTNPDMAGQGDNLTGMNSTETDVSEGPGPDGNSFISWMTVNSGETYYIVIDRPFGQSNFSLQWTGTAIFESQPTLPVGVSMDLQQCDHDLVDDGSTAFDLTQNNPIMIGTQTGVTLSYHTSSNDALTGDNPIPDPTNFTNTTNPQPVFVRIENNATGCFDQMEFSVQVSNGITIPNGTFTICDNGTDGDGTNGQTNFNLNDVTTAIFGAQSTSGLTIKYYSSQFNALNDISAFPTNTFYNTAANQQLIYVWASDPVGGCSTIKEITLNVIPQPLVTNTTLVQCDIGLHPDGITTFNLNAAIPALTVNTSTSLLNIAFFENGNPNPVNSNYTNLTNPQSLTAEVTNVSTGCKNTAILMLAVNTSPNQPVTVAPQCDIVNVEDGIGHFDLTASDLVLLPGQTAAFYENENDALLEQNAIADFNSYPNAVPYFSTAYVRVEGGNNCASINEMHLVVNKLPNIVREETGLFVCDDNPDYHITLNAAILEGIPADYTYDWFLDGNALSLHTYEISVNVAGIYTVLVTRLGCTIVRTITVSDSENANIESILVDDFVTDTNTITINITGTSLGSYVYALDHPDTVYQESNVFENVPPGIHDLYIKDLYACGIFGPVQINVLGVPRYFTPNGDGYNDTWNMKGADAASNKNSTIYIFDRYGKLLTRISPVGRGWDGTYSDKPLPADDYWYTISLDNGRNTKGHFSLKR